MTLHAGRQGGFTLLEVLLAMGITATVMVTVGTTFHVLLNARDVVDDLAESTEAGPRILNLIERDLRGLWVYNIKNNAVLKGTNADVGGRDADRIDFLTTTDAVAYVLDLQDRPLKPSLCEVGYWFKPNPKYRDVFEMWRREDPMVDNDLATGGSFQLVHDRVKSFKVRYYETLGFEAEERFEWDSSTEDMLPKRIKIEFTIERRRGSRNVVSDAEVEDFEGAEKTYVRHFVVDERLNDILRAETARIPVLPVEPEEQGNGPAGPAGAGGPAGPGGAATVTQGFGPGGPGGAGGKGDGGGRVIEAGKGAGAGGRGGQGGGRGGGPGTATGSGPIFQGGTGGQVPGGLPPGFDIGQFLRGIGGGSGGGGLFPGS